MQLMTFLVLTTLFWGLAAIFDKLALGKVAPLSGLMVRQFIVTGVLIPDGDRQWPVGRGIDYGVAFGALLRVEWNLRRNRRALDLLSCPPAGRGVIGCAHHSDVSISHRPPELGHSAGESHDPPPNRDGLHRFGGVAGEIIKIILFSFSVFFPQAPPSWLPPFLLSLPLPLLKGQSFSWCSGTWGSCCRQ